MMFTRQQAEALLNKAEMPLFNASRSNELRKLSVADLDKRIVRARAVRDRARDLVQRQKLATRASTGSKRGMSGMANERSRKKAELTADILKRFEAQLKVAKKKEKEAAQSRGSKAPAKKAASKKNVAGKAAAKKVAVAARRASAAELRRIAKTSDPAKAMKKAASARRAKQSSAT